MNLSEVNSGIKKHKKGRRVGRGPGSGRGKTSSRGHKGQGQLAGWSHSPVFEGGRMPLVRRVPKRGFNNQWARVVYSINVSQLEKLFADGAEVTPRALEKLGVTPSQFDLVKILGNGELTKKLKVAAHRFSKSAAEKIQQAGGEVVVLAGPKSVEEKKKAAKEARKKAAT